MSYTVIKGREQSRYTPRMSPLLVYLRYTIVPIRQYYCLLYVFHAIRDLEMYDETLLADKSHTI